MYKLETKLAQIGNRSETKTGTVNVPIYLATAYRHAGIGQSTGFDYTRTGNPTRQVLEQTIADLECGDAGFACSSGMAAIWTLLSLFQSGDELIVSEDLYGGTYRLFEEIYRKYGLICHYVNTSDVVAIREKINEQTKAVFLETPTNPLMKECDIAEVASLAKKHNLLCIVDNTFYTPILQQPITLGVDIVIHSATKYLGGHNDVLAGLLVVKGKDLCEKIGKYHNAGGAVLSPFDSWLLMRGMKTLSLRMKKHEENAKEMVSFLENREEITDVLYPGKGGMLSFRVKHQSLVNPFLQSLSLICFAESLGGVESFITYPTTQTHMDIPVEIRNERGVCDRLLRFSVGIEDIEDLREDLSQALVKACEIVYAEEIR